MKLGKMFLSLFAFCVCVTSAHASADFSFLSRKSEEEIFNLTGPRPPNRPVTISPEHNDYLYLASTAEEELAVGGDDDSVWLNGLYSKRAMHICEHYGFASMRNFEIRALACPRGGCALAEVYFGENPNVALFSRVRRGNKNYFPSAFTEVTCLNR